MKKFQNIKKMTVGKKQSKGNESKYKHLNEFFKVVHAQDKAGNTSKKLTNQILEIIYLLYRRKNY